MMKLINVGFGNFVASERLVSIVGPDSSPSKRTISEAKEKGTLVDATCGRKTRAVLVMDSFHIVLSALQPETIAARVNEICD